MPEITLPIFSLSLCTFCGYCVKACPENALIMLPAGPRFKAPDLCTYCTVCETVCPEHAIQCPLEIKWI